jgi:hypothetical protein
MENESFEAWLERQRQREDRKLRWATLRVIVGSLPFFVMCYFAPQDITWSGFFFRFCVPLYLVLTLFAAFFRGGSADSVASILLQWVAWGWFYYWAFERHTLLPAFAGPLLIFGAFGRFVTYVQWRREQKRRET